MRKFFFFLFVICHCGPVANAQLMPGFEQSPYAGIHSGKYNPAALANSPYRFYVNVASVHARFDNNLFSFSKEDILNRSFDRYQKPADADVKKGLAEYGTVLPSFMFNISPAYTIALTNRFRKMANLNNLSANTAQLLGDSSDLNALSGQVFTNQNASFNFNSWVETGLSIAHVFVNNGNLVIKGGLTLKLLKGVAANYIYTDNLSFKLIGNNNSSALNRLVETKGSISYGYSNNLENSITKQQLLSDFSNAEAKSGFGADAGIEFEWPDTDYEQELTSHYLPHKMKIGMGISDFGKLSYANSNTASTIGVNNVNISIQILSQRSNETIDQYTQRLRDLFKGAAGPKEFELALPLTIHGYIDRKIRDRFYVNAFASIPLSKKSKSVFDNHYLYALAVAPRYETKHITVALPLSYNELKQFNAGIAFRGGPFFIGSGSIITNLFTTTVSHANVYAGIAIGLKKNKRITEKKQSSQKEEEIRRVEFSAKNVYFESDKTTLLGYSYETLDTMATFLKKNTSARLVVEGHTDSTGSKENNLLLSQARADAVVEYLKQKGISEKQLIAIGQGTNKPLSDNATPEGRAKNRRVEFRIINNNDKSSGNNKKNK